MTSLDLAWFKKVELYLQEKVYPYVSRVKENLWSVKISWSGKP